MQDWRQECREVVRDGGHRPATCMPVTAGAQRARHGAGHAASSSLHLARHGSRQRGAAGCCVAAACSRHVPRSHLRGSKHLVIPLEQTCLEVPAEPGSCRCCHWDDVCGALATNGRCQGCSPASALRLAIITLRRTVSRRMTAQPWVAMRWYSMGLMLAEGVAAKGHAVCEARTGTHGSRRSLTTERPPFLNALARLRSARQEPKQGAEATAAVGLRRLWVGGRSAGDSWETARSTVVSADRSRSGPAGAPDSR